MRSLDEAERAQCRAARDDHATLLPGPSRAVGCVEDLHSAAGEVIVRLAPRRAGLGSAASLRPSRAFFVELALHELGDRGERGFRFSAFGRDHDRGAGRGGEHHQSHDGCAADSLAAACHPDFGVEAFDGLDEFCGGARMQAALVDDQKLFGDGVLGHPRPGNMLDRRFVVVAHLPARTRLAMVTYLRPASCAIAIASGSERSSRTLASFTSMGRLMPASTSTFGRLMQEIARLDGVPPNMSVRIATPSPESTRLTASMMSLRQRSESSSAPIVTASICFCGPITCSSAALNSSARRPWVTSTRPIIGNSSRVPLVHRTNAPL